MKRMIVAEKASSFSLIAVRNVGFNSIERCRAWQQNIHCHKGFTLAEVLITLAVIGVVAALTIPGLIQNYQSRAWNTASLVFERKLEDALKVMNTQQTLAGYNSTGDFVEELSKHFKILKICNAADLTGCFEDTVSWGSGDDEPQMVDMNEVKTAKNLGHQDWNTEVLGVQFGNGTNGVIAYNPECHQDPYSNQITGTSCLALLYDTSGYKSPNASGKDLRSINVNKLGKACAVSVDGLCFGTAFKADEPMSMADCEREKDALKIKKCVYEKDYWAGAVKRCGGADKMPSNAQLAVLANYLYNTDKIGASGNASDVILDLSKVSELGFDNGTKSFTVWSNREKNHHVDKWGFRENSLTLYNLSFDGFGRNESSQYGICLE